MLPRFALVLSLLAVPLAAQRNAADRLSYPPGTKLLIIHADDLAVAHSADRASFAALEAGHATSASILVPCPWLTEVADYAREHPKADLGLHLTLTSEWNTYRWGPLAAGVPSLLDPSGYFWKDSASVIKQGRPEEVERELRAQIERALKLGIHPTHLDSHMGTTLAPPFAPIYVKLAREFNLPFLAVRTPALEPLLKESDVIPDTILGIPPGTKPEGWLQYYQQLVANLKPGLTELIVHLGYDDAELQAITGGSATPWGSGWRQRDYDAMSSPDFQRTLRDTKVTLIGWRDIQERSHQLLRPPPVH